MLPLAWRRTFHFSPLLRDSAHAVDPEQQRAAEPAPVHARRLRFSAIHTSTPSRTHFSHLTRQSPVVVNEEFVKHGFEMAVAEDEKVIEQFSACGPDPALRE